MSEILEVKDYETIMWAEMKPDLYHGENCDQVKPQWEAYADGDMDSERGLEVVDYQANLFPPGTKILVQQPVCPSCHEIAELCMEDDYCNFDWEEWRDNQYS